MLNFKITTQLHKERVARAVHKTGFRNLFHAAASITKDAKASIVPGRGPSAAGTPPHTGRRRKLQRAVRFDVDRENQIAVIGPRASFAGTSGAAHEFGGTYKAARFDERPFMQPALERAAPRFAGQWRGGLAK
ncbi:MAG: hypothetical protein KDA57_22050 [Planctomycetales bacterium]|nr:hypothetical protein [Planctomycetales bacterium]